MNSFEDPIAELSELAQAAIEGQRTMYELGRQHQAELSKIEADYQAQAAKLEAEHAAKLAQVEASRRLGVDYIRGPVGEGYIYVIAFTTGVVKVGQTEDPATRLNRHQSKALAFGVGTTNYWISPSHRNYMDNETRLIALCSRVSRRSRLEYFHEVGYERASQFARSLAFDSAVPDQRAVECGWS